MLLEGQHIGDAAAGEEVRREGPAGSLAEAPAGRSPRDAGAVGGGSAAPAVSPVCGVVACCIKHMAVAFKSLFKAPLFYCTNGHSALLG